MSPTKGNSDSQFDVPILFLIFRRPHTTAKVFEKIKKVKPKKLYIAADGPRGWVRAKQRKFKLQENMF